MKKQIFAASLVATGLLVTTVAFAQMAPSDTSAAIAQKVRKAPTVASCETIGANLDKRVSKFEKDRVKKVAQYGAIQKKMNSLLARMEAAGYDTTEVRVSMVTMNQKIAKFSNDYQVYQNELSGTSEFTCGKSEGEFRAKLSLAREQLKVVRQDAVEIRTFWAKTVKPQIEALKAQETQTSIEGGSL